MAPWNQPRMAATMTMATMSTSTQFMDSKLDRPLARNDESSPSR